METNEASDANSPENSGTKEQEPADSYQFKDGHQGDYLDELRQQLLVPTLNNAVFTGFTTKTYQEGALDAGLTKEDALIAWPHGADDIFAFWSSEADKAAVRFLTREGAAGRIRDRVTGAVWARLEYFEPHKEAARRAANMLAFPLKQPLAAQLAWRSADAIWTGLNDPSRDFNYYSKRGILSAVISSTQLRWLTDEAPNAEATREFLHARIENVMQIEKFKARLKDLPFDPTSFIRTAAKARYRE